MSLLINGLFAQSLRYASFHEIRDALKLNFLSEKIFKNKEAGSGYCF